MGFLSKGIPGLRGLHNLPGLGWTAKIPGTPLGSGPPKPSLEAQTPIAPVGPPLPPQTSDGSIYAQARSAADKQRKRTRAGATGLHPPGTAAGPRPRTQARSLLGY